MTDSVKVNYFSRFILFIVLVTLAALLRFYHLGTWSHGFDENYTTMETQYFFEGQPIPLYMLQNSSFDPEQSHRMKTCGIGFTIIPNTKPDSEKNATILRCISLSCFSICPHRHEFETDYSSRN